MNTKDNRMKRLNEELKRICEEPLTEGLKYNILLDVEPSARKRAEGMIDNGLDKAIKSTMEEFLDGGFEVDEASQLAILFCVRYVNKAKKKLM